MLDWMTPRKWYFFAFVSCTVLVCFALYNQYIQYLSPCPLCVLQRIAFMWMGVAALLAFLHNPGRLGRQVYAWLLVAGAVFGAVIAGRHVWLQNLPAELVPECSPGLNYMIQNFPLSDIFSTIFYGSGDCADVLWTFLGMSMPQWTFVWYIGLSLLTLWAVYRRVGN